MTHHEPEPQPTLDLDQVEADYLAYLEESRPSYALGERGQAAINAVPDLVAELREARAEIERLNGLPTEQEFIVCVGGDQHPDDCEAMIPAADADEAIHLVKAIGEGRAMIHMRHMSLHPWIRLDSEPPF